MIAHCTLDDLLRESWDIWRSYDCARWFYNVPDAPHPHPIMNNHAMKGGGIYVEDNNTVTITPCFFQLLDLQYPRDTKITLENDTADEAGSAVYGGQIDRCLPQSAV